MAEKSNTETVDIDLVYLPRIISDEFGMAEQNAREAILEGDILIADVKWEGDKMNLPLSEIVGKEISVQGKFRSVRFTINES